MQFPLKYSQKKLIFSKSFEWYSKSFSSYLTLTPFVGFGDDQKPSPITTLRCKVAPVVHPLFFVAHPWVASRKMFTLQLHFICMQTLLVVFMLNHRLTKSFPTSNNSQQWRVSKHTASSTFSASFSILENT